MIKGLIWKRQRIAFSLLKMEMTRFSSIESACLQVNSTPQKECTWLLHHDDKGQEREGPSAHQTLFSESEENSVTKTIQIVRNHSQYIAASETHKEVVTRNLGQGDCSLSEQT